MHWLDLAWHAEVGTARWQIAIICRLFQPSMACKLQTLASITLQPAAEYGNQAQTQASKQPDVLWMP